MTAERTMDAAGDDRIIAFLFTDIEGSTGHAQRFPAGMRVAHARHDEIIRKASETFGGDLFQSVGDGFKVAFFDPAAAVRAAFEAQRALQTVFMNEAGTMLLRVRMAIHAGMTQVRDGEYVGLTPSKASRLVETIHGGQIVITGDTAEMARGHLPGGAALQDIGEYKLRDFETPDRLFQIAHPDLPANFPPLRPTDAVPNNLPNQLLHLVGREIETEEIRQRIVTYPLVTLTGAGGCGKTRLALHVADRFLRKFPEGVWFIDLSPSAEAESIARAAADVLGIKSDSDSPLTRQVLAHLVTRRCLLILDNCEHLIDAAADFAAELLRTCKDVRVLATSREALGIGGEALYPVPPLPVPPDDIRDPRALMTYDSVRQFALQARLKSPPFRLTNENVFAVARICRTLDGIPLGVYLMASWADALTPEQMETQMAKRFKFPKAAPGERSLPARHLNVRAAIEYSLDLLTESERALLRRLSIFSGGFTLDAAEAVCDAPPLDDVLESLTLLLRKSLIEAEDTPFGKRYRLLQPIREYALESLKGHGEHDALRARHRDYFVEWTEAIAPRLISAEMLPAMQETDRDIENIRAALSAAGTLTNALKIFASIAWYWRVRGHIHEGVGWADQLMRLDAAAPIADQRLRALARNRAGILYWDAGNLGVARRVFNEALNLSRSLNDAESVAKCLSNLGSIACKQKHYADSSRFLEESLALYKQLHLDQRVMDVLINLGANAIYERDYDLAQDYFERALQMQQGQSNRLGYAASLQNLAAIARRKRNFVRAKRLLRESIDLQKELDYEGGILYCLSEIPFIAFDEGRTTDAATLVGYFEEYKSKAEYADTFATLEDSAEWAEFKTNLIKILGADYYEEKEEKGRLLNHEEFMHIAQLDEENSDLS